MKLSIILQKPTKKFIVQKVKEELITVSRQLKKSCLSCKNPNNQAMLHRSKTVDSVAVLQAIEANLLSSTYQVSLSSHSLLWVILFSTSAKASRASELCLMLPNTAKLLTPPSNFSS